MLKRSVHIRVGPGPPWLCFYDMAVSSSTFAFGTPRPTLPRGRCSRLNRQVLWGGMTVGRDTDGGSGGSGQTGPRGIMVPGGRVELPTSGSTIQRSNQLSYPGIPRMRTRQVEPAAGRKIIRKGHPLLQTARAWRAWLCGCGAFTSGSPGCAFGRWCCPRGR